MTWLTDLPWKVVRDVGFSIRKVVASKKRPNRPHLVIDESVDEIVDLLRTENFRSGWFLSYHYMGEDGNLSRAEFSHEGESEMQLHIRLFEREDGRTDVFAHYELCPLAHPKKHIKGNEQSVDKGVLMTMSIFDDNGIGYEQVDPESEE